MMKYALEIGFNIQKLEVKMWISEDWIALWLEGMTCNVLDYLFIIYYSSDFVLLEPIQNLPFLDTLF